jgi:hypothetical protein
MGVVAAVWRSRLAWCVKFSREPQSKVVPVLPDLPTATNKYVAKALKDRNENPIKNRD